MSYHCRIVDTEGVTWWDGATQFKQSRINMAVYKPSRYDTIDNAHVVAPLTGMYEIDAVFEREIGPEDGGPLYIYRLNLGQMLK